MTLDDFAPFLARLILLLAASTAAASCASNPVTDAVTGIFSGDDSSSTRPFMLSFLRGDARIRSF